MRRCHVVEVLATLILTASLAVPAPAATDRPLTAAARLMDAHDKQVGMADLVQTGGGVLIRLTITGMPAGEHAIHIHAIGKCEAPFDSAGPHFNPDNNKHGVLSDGGHAGDLPNLHIPQGGSVTVEMLSPRITLAKGSAESLFDTDGAAIVIHEKADDYKSDPAGDSGDRIACGVIREGAASTPVGRSPER